MSIRELLRSWMENDKTLYTDRPGGAAKRVSDGVDGHWEVKMPGEKPETHYVHVGQERRIAYCEYGDPQGLPVFYFHGTPGSRYEPAWGDQAGKDHGYRILALDRPGIGRSDYVRGRKLLDWPDDVVAVAGQLAINRFGVIGVSGGGPYALACSHALADRLDFTVLLGSWGPVAEEPDLWNAMAPLDRFFGKLSNVAPWAFYLPFSFLGYAAKRLSPQRFIKSLESSLCAADQQLLADAERARFFAGDVAEGFRQGARGPADDAMLLYGPWGFRVGEIGANVALYHGTHDKFAPFRYAVYLDERLPHAELHAYPGEGHLFVMTLFDRIFERLSHS